jgi:hypothetical protein
MADPRTGKNQPQDKGQWNPNQGNQPANTPGKDAGKDDQDKNKSMNKPANTAGRTEDRTDSQDNEDARTPAGESETPDFGDATRQKDQRPL